MTTIRRAATAACAVAALSLSSAVLADGNRYDLERRYHSEVSAAEAYLLTHHDRGNKAGNAFANAVLIDVRRIEEYVAGHAENALHIPFPHITNMVGYIPQDPQVFVDAVAAAVPDRSTPILLMCRTGFRSVLAGNLLADAGYTNVRNVWQGFVGNAKVDTAGNTLDVNNDGQITEADHDGWSGFQGLPYTTKLRKTLLYSPYEYLYYQ